MTARLRVRGVRCTALALAALALAALAPAGCSPALATGTDTAVFYAADGGLDSDIPGSDSAAPGCPAGLICPELFPFHDDNDTSMSTARVLDAYGCAPGIDESGPEVIYRVDLPIAGFLSAGVSDADMVDIDLHLLSDLDPAACLDRGDRDVGAHVPAGTYYVVADSWVSPSSGELSGAYALDIGFVIAPTGSCAMTNDVVDRIAGPPVVLPGTGPVVKEAHLVTDADGFGGGWPSAISDGIRNHYDVSFAATAFVMGRGEAWAPMESSEFGQGSTGAPLPVEDESWHINMYWSDRPPGGTRMIVRRPGGGPAVVASAGYETGPGNPAHIAGVAEEVHFYLGTGHLDDLTIGFAVDQTLPLGPIDCGP